MPEYTMLQERSLLEATTAKDKGLPIPQSPADETDFQKNWTIYLAQSALEESANHPEQFPHAAWKKIVKEVIKAIRSSDYFRANQIIYAGILNQKNYSNEENGMFNFFIVPPAGGSLLLAYLVKYKINVFYLVGANTDLIRHTVSRFAGEHSKNLDDEQVPIIIILMAMLIFALSATREQRLQTDSFMQTVPIGSWLPSIIRIIYPWILINITCLVALFWSTLLLHWTTGLPFGNLSFADPVSILTGITIVPTWFYLLTTMFYLNLWLGFFAVFSTLLAQFNKSPVVITFFSGIVFFLQYLGLLELVPKSLKNILPSTYTHFPLMFTRQGVYGSLTSLRLLICFVSWILVCILLTITTRLIRRRYYFAR